MPVSPSLIIKKPDQFFQAKSTNVDFLSALPNELALIILSYLPWPALLRVQQVNRELHKLISDVSVWKNFFKQYLTLAPYAFSFTLTHQYKNFLQTNIAAIKALKHEAQYYLTKRFVHKDLRAGLFFLRPETETEIITLIDRLRMLLEEPFPSPEELNNALNKINTLLSENQFEVWNIPPIDENGYSKTLTLKGLTRLTAEFLALPNIHLVQNIDLHLSHLRQLPPSFSLFTHLKTLDLKNNPLSEFPMVLLQAPFTTSLEDLNISFTKIREIPAEISALGGILDKLSFSGNSVNIAVLPETLLKLKPSGVAAFTSRAIQFNSTESAFSSGENDSSVSKTHLVSMGHRVNKKEIPENRNPMTGTSEPQSEESARKRIRRI